MSDQLILGTRKGTLLLDRRAGGWTARPIAHPGVSISYAARDPRDEAIRLITGTPSHILEINHYLFSGRLNFIRPFRALVAGGGTGDACIMLAQQLVDRRCPGEVVYLDLSTASRQVCEARAKARGLRNIQFLTGSLLDLPSMKIGQFDYIDCTGVLHHLVDPRTGTAASSLASVTVIGCPAMLADGLATAAFILGPEKGLALLERHGADGLLISPSLDYRGVRIEAAMREYGSRPALLVASRQDSYASRSARELARNAPGIRELQWTDLGAHGTALLSREPELVQALLDWFRRTLPVA